MIMKFPSYFPVEVTSKFLSVMERWLAILGSNEGIDFGDYVSD